MRITGDEGEQLSAEASAIISALIQSAPSTMPDEVDRAALFAVACDVADRSEEASVLEPATRSAKLRRTLTRLRQRALELAKSPSSANLESEEDRLILAGLQQKMAVSLRLAAAPAADVSGLRWSELRARAGALGGLVRAVSASIARSHSSLSFAIYRQPPGAANEFEILTGVTARLGVASSGSGLEIEVLLTGDLGQGLDEVIGKNLVLLLIDPAGGAVPVHAGAIEGPRWHVALDDFSVFTGLDSEQLSATDFRVQLEENLKLAAPKQLLYVDVPPKVRREGMVTIPAELSGPASVKDNLMTIEISLPRRAIAMFRDLNLDVSIGFGPRSLCVASYPLSDWPEGFRRLQISLSDVPEGQIECGSIIQLQLSIPV